MKDDIAALIPPAVMATLFIVLLVVAFRATDGARRRRSRNGSEIRGAASGQVSSDGPAEESSSDTPRTDRDAPTD